MSLPEHVHPRRQQLVRILRLLIFLIIVAFTFVYLSGLLPSQPGGGASTGLDISGLAPGQARLVYRRGRALWVVRQQDSVGSPAVYKAETQKTEVLLRWESTARSRVGMPILRNPATGESFDLAGQPLGRATGGEPLVAVPFRMVGPDRLEIGLD